MTRTAQQARALEATATIAWGNRQPTASQMLASVLAQSDAWDARYDQLLADHNAYRARLDALHGSENGNG